MEEMYWKQFWETGNVTDYLNYRNCIDTQMNLESEETRESDYSDGNGFAGVTYR